MNESEVAKALRSLQDEIARLAQGLHMLLDAIQVQTPLLMSIEERLERIEESKAVD